MGFNIYKTYNKYISAGEIDKPVELTIKEVKKELIYSIETRKKEPSLVVYFDKTDRGVCMSKKRAFDIGNLYGSDTDLWKGKKIVMYTEQGTYFGKTMNIIRFKTDKSAELAKELDQIALSQS